MNKFFRMNAAVFLVMLALGDVASGANFLVSNPSEISTKSASAQPGDTLIMTNGVWPDADILFRGNGTAVNPVTLRAQTPGQVLLSSSSRLRISGNYLVVDGLQFTNGYRTSGDIIAFRSTSGSVSSPATNCLLTNCAVIDYNPPDATIDTKWVSLYGTSNRVENCYFKGKSNLGSTLVVFVDAQPDSPNYHHIARNYFGPRPPLGVNGGESIRVGSSDVSMNLSRTLVENNYFEQCNGDVEIVSNKSGENEYRYNTFVECQGAFSLRHGNRCRVEGNYFLGHLKPGTGGVRIVAEDHKVFNNYFAELTGTQAASPLSIMQGLVNSPLNGYFQVQRATVAFNTFVNCQNGFVIGLTGTLTGTTNLTTLPPVDCTIANNLVLGSSGKLVDQRIDPVNMLWQGNLMYGTTLGIATTSGISLLDPILELGSDGFWRPAAGSPALAGGQGIYDFVIEDIEGQPRPATKDIGCDQLSAAPVLHPPLTLVDVGPVWLPTRQTLLQWSNPADIPYGTALGAAQLNATANVPGTFVYTPAAGTILNIGGGQSLSVIFTPADHVKFISATQSVTINVAQAAPLVSWPNPSDLEYGTGLGAAELNATANVPGTFVYSPPAGTILDTGAGQVLSLTFTPTDTVHYTMANQSVTINVVGATPVIIWPNPDILPYGNALSGTQLNAIANVPGTFNYAPPAGTVPNAGSGQILSVTFSPDDTAHYATVTQTVTINVFSAVPLTPAVAWPAPADLAHGTALSGAQLNATANVPGTFAYAPPAGTILNVGNGQTLSLIFTPNDTTNFVIVTKAVTVNVLKAMPRIVWPHPADISFGTPLSGVQLNATVDAPGTLIYNPPAGTVLNMGNGQILAVTFMPADPASYLGAGSTVTIDVGNRVNSDMIRVAYLIPTNRVAQSNGVANLQNAMLLYQSWFRDQMDLNGFGQKTFAVETEADGVTPVIHTVPVAETDDYLMGDIGGERVINAARAAGVSIGTSGQVWWLIPETHHEYAEGVVIGGFDLSYNYGGSSEAPGWAIWGSDSLALCQPAFLTNNTPYDTLLIPEFGSYPLQQDVSFPWFDGQTLSSVSSSVLGAGLRQLAEGLGLDHDFRNDENFNGNLMGFGFSGIRGALEPKLYPYNDTRLSYGMALALNVNPYFNSGRPVTDEIQPALAVTTTGAKSPRNGLLNISFSASDAGGLSAALLSWNTGSDRVLVGEMALSGTSVTQTFDTGSYVPGQTNLYTLSVFDLQGNKQSVTTAIVPTAGLNHAPLPSIQVTPVTAGLGEDVVLDASATVDREHSASLLEVEWDLDGDGIFDTPPAASLLFTNRYLALGNRLIRARISDPAGDQAVSAPVALRITLCPAVLSPSSRSHGFGMSTGAVKVTTSPTCNWTVFQTNDWITITSNAISTGSASVSYVLSDNPSFSPRIGVLMIADQFFTITQQEITCAFSLSPANRFQGFGASTNTVKVTTKAGCPWTVSNTNSWITIVSNASGAGSGTITYALAANRNPTERTGVLNVGDQLYTVTQWGTNCTLVISPDHQVYDGGAGTGLVSVAASSSCSWGVENTNDWITIPSANTGSGLGTVSYTVNPNPGPGVRTGVFMIGSESFSVTQSACAYQISPPQQVLDYGPGAAMVNVATSDGCNWKVRNTNDWITLLSEGPGLGSGSIVYAVTANQSHLARTGVLLIAGQPFTVTQVGIPCSLDIEPTDWNHGAGWDYGEISVTTDSDCDWSVVNTASWITILSGASGAGNGSVVYTVDANAGPARIGTLLVAGLEFTVEQASGLRSVQLGDMVVVSGQTNCLAVVLDAQGTENALNFSLCYDTNLLTFASALLSGAPGGSALSVNTSKAALGQVGLSAALPPGWSISAGRQTVVNVCFQGAFVNGAVLTPVTLCDQPIARQMVDVLGQSVPANYLNGLVEIDGSCTLGYALDAPQLSWITNGSPAWMCQTNVSRDGLAAAQSGAIGDSGSTSIQTTLNGPGTVSFWWKVSSETNNDTLRFFFGTTEQARISGEVDWQFLTFNVPSGSPVLKWTYSKNSSLASGQDAAWVDQVQFTPAGPVITSQPASQSAGSGTTATFNVTATATPPLSYQWQFNGINLIDGGGVRGASTASLVLSNVQPEQAGIYSVLLSNATGSLASSNAALTVVILVPLAEALDTQNWIWTTTGSPPWVGQTGVSHDGVDAAQSGAIVDGQTTTMLTTLNGPGTFSFWWKVSSEPSNDRLRLYLDGSEQLRISGEVDWQLQTLNIASGSHTLEFRYSKNSSKAVGQDRGWVDQVQFAPAPPAITSQPVSQDVDSGTTVTFSVAASGAPPLLYQWQLNGIDLSDGGAVSGATTATLKLSKAQADQAGAYSVMVNNPVGSLTSSNALLTVSPVLPLAEALDATNLVWTTSGSPPWTGQPVVTHDGVDAGRSGAIGDGTTTSMQTTVSGPGTVSFWWKVSSETNNDSFRFSVGGSEQARISGEVDWQWRTFPVSSGSQALKWNYSKNSSLAAGQDRAWVDQVLFIPNSAPTAPLIASQPASQNVVAKTSVTFSVGAAGSAPLSYQWQLNGANLLNSTNVSGATTASLTLPSAQGTQAGTYSVLVSNPVGNVTSADALLTVITAPMFSSQPADQSVAVGATVNFNVGAIGMAPLSYQWQFNDANLSNGGNVSGATTSTLKLSGAQAAQAGTYSVLVMNAAGNVTSSSAFLVVAIPPAIISQPPGQSVVAGSNAIINVSANGSPPLSYQWRFNGTNLAESAGVTGATTASLTLATVQPAQAGPYSVVVNNLVGSATSSNAPLAVISPPSITSQPSSQSVAEAATVNFSAAVTGSAPLSYQWLRNGTNLVNAGTVNGATTATLTLAGVLPVQAGSYSVVVSNAGGTVTSSNALLKVAAALTLADALDAPYLVWITGGSAPWLAQTNVMHDGVDAARSGAISGNQTSALQTTVTGPGTLRFWWKASSETNHDRLVFSVDGVEWARISGEVDWQWEIFDLQAGSHLLQWAYSKDSFGAGGQDRAWLDQVEFTPVFGPTPPVITSQPLSQTVAPGSTVAFSGAVSGAGQLSYQWRFNGADLVDGDSISGATADTLVLLNVRSAQAGAYNLVVRNDYSLDISSNALLTVIPFISLAETLDTTYTNLVWTAGGYSPWTGQNSVTHDWVDAAQSGPLPDSQTNWIQTFVNGPAAVNFWWKVSSQTNRDRLRFYINGVEQANISGQVDWRWRTFDLTNATQVLRWAYTKDTNGTAGLDRGWVDQVQVGPVGPIITRQPLTQTADSGAMVNLNVGVSGSSPLNYNWEFNGINLLDGPTISGSTLSRVVLSNAQPAESGAYAVTVFNRGGRAISTNVSLTITPGQPLAQVVNTGTNIWNTGWTTGGDAPWVPQTAVNHDGVDAAQSGAIADLQRTWLETTVTGPGKVSFWWRVSSQTNTPTPGISGDTLRFYAGGIELARISGQVGWQLLVLDVTNGIQVLHWRYQKDSALAGGSDAGWVDQIQFAQVLPPILTNQPVSRSVDPGTPVTFNVGAVGSPPFSFQWRRNGTNLLNGASVSGATTPTLSLSSVQADQAGTYSVTVSNAAARVISSNAVLAVTPTLPLAAALDIPTWTWTSSGSPPWLGQSIVTHDGVDAARNGIIGDGASTSMQTTLIGPGIVTFWWKVSSETNKDLLQFAVGGSLQAQISGEVDWQQASFNVPSGSQVLKWTYSKNSSVAVGQDRGWVDQVQFAGLPVTLTSQPASQSVDEGATVTFTVAAAGTPPFGYQWQLNGANLADGGNVSGTLTAKLTLSSVQVAQSGNYSVVVSNTSGSMSSSNALLTVTPLFSLADALDTPPTWTWTTSGSPPWVGQPVVTHDGVDAARSGAIGDGGSGSMQTTVTGPGTVSFWWKVSSETNNDTLRFFIGSTEQARISGEVNWQLKAFNLASGSQVLKWTYSKNGSLAGGLDRGWVDQVQLGAIIPVLTSQPVSQAIDSGTSATFSVVAAGTPPFSYQWQLNGANLVDGSSVRGATTATLTLSNAQPAQTGIYAVLVGNAAGTITSSNALLTVTPLLPLAEALDTPPTTWTWTTSGSPPWVGQAAVSHDGVDAARSGGIGDGATTSMQTTVNGPGTLSFWWKVSSEPNNDFLRFSVGGIEQARISGEVAWQLKAFNIASGSQTLQWTYSKNSSLAGGQDRAWVDEVQFGLSAPVITSQPTSQTVGAGTTASFTVAAAGTPPLSYQWQFNGANLSDGGSVAGSTTATLTFSNAQPSQSGTISVVVGNAAGSVASSNAVLTVLTVLPVVSLADALDTPTWSWRSSSTPPWTGQTLVTQDGQDAAWSGALADGATSSMLTTINGPGTLTFWWKVSSETNNDVLHFYVGSTELAFISGEVNWQQQTFTIPSGSQTLKWSYKKNGSLAGGQDGAWVDQVVFPAGVAGPNPAGTVGLVPAGTNVTTIAATVTVSGSRVALTWPADTTKTYQVFYKDSLSDPDWINVDGEVLLTWKTVNGAVVTGSALATVEDILAGQTRFYQVVEY